MKWGGGSNAFWTMFKRTAELVKWGTPKEKILKPKSRHWAANGGNTSPPSSPIAWWSPPWTSQHQIIKPAVQSCPGSASAACHIPRICSLGAQQLQCNAPFLAHRTVHKCGLLLFIVDPLQISPLTTQVSLACCVISDIMITCASGSGRSSITAIVMIATNCQEKLHCAAQQAKCKLIKCTCSRVEELNYCYMRYHSGICHLQHCLNSKDKVVCLLTINNVDIASKTASVC